MRLKRSRKQRNRGNNQIGPVINDYKPLLGEWLIEMALLLNWYRPIKSGIWPDIFTDDDFLVLTGINGPDEDEVDEDEHSYVGRPTASKCRKILEAQLKKLRKIKLPDTLHLFNNIELLAELIGLNEADQGVLAFAVAVDLVSEFRGALFTRCEKASNQLICQILARLTGLSETDFHAAIREDSLLISTGIIRNARSIVEIDEKLTVIDGLSPILLTPHLSAEELTGRFLKRAANSTLSLDHFPHLAKDAGALKDYLKNVLEDRVQGVNILLHGKPGVGKTEFVQSLVADLGADLYEIAFANEDGDPIKGTERLHAFNFCQRLLARTTNAVLMFDEIEDVFPVDYGMFSFLMGDIGGGKSKAWINRTMERNPVPAIWVCNRVGHIDPAYLRRFDYSIAFSAPPVAVRLRIAKHHLGCFDPPQTMLESIARNDEITPGQLDRAAKVARIAGRGDKIRAIQLVEQTLDKSITLLGQKRTANRGVLRTGYHLEFLNTDFDIPAIVHGLKRRPHGTFCFYGEAGTGKSELARYISEEIGMPLIIKWASDLISKWVGESEKNIAAMFTEARQQDALLLLDEADSFLADRRDAQRSWEVTQVNELLTQMEAFEGIFICTTNLMAKLDPACLRRFAFKVKFCHLTVDQKKRMFCQELIRLGCLERNIDAWESKVSELHRLTPGDFAVAARQFELWDIPATPGKLYEMLLKECEAKGASTRSIGFNGKSML